MISSCFDYPELVYRLPSDVNRLRHFPRPESIRIGFEGVPDA